VNNRDQPLVMNMQMEVFKVKLKSISPPTTIWLCQPIAKLWR